MITKEECIPGVIVTVNSKKSKTNSELGARNGGLTCFKWSPSGSFSIGDPMFEMFPGTKIEILSPAKKIGTCGVQVKFKVVGDNNVFSAWWCAFKPKVDL